ncbi:hypothetical protein HF888_16445 (plasmid) [Bermanella marisrubri]|nr:hypothetical protein [Bermanella marisrubri]QIZ85930.1 hypothetical protein HF888_16445 [Bermanella marisrubri]
MTEILSSIFTNTIGGIATVLLFKFLAKRSKKVRREKLVQLSEEKENIENMREDTDLFLRYSFYSLFRMIFLIMVGVFGYLLTLFPSQTVERAPDVWYMFLFTLSAILLVGSFQEARSAELVLDSKKFESYFSKKMKKFKSNDDA